MKRVLLLLATMAMAAAALAPAASAQVPTQDSVAGSGVTPFFGGFSIDVRSGPSGENPAGSASFTFEGLTGTPSCLAVRGNVATFNLETIFGLVTFEATDNAGRGVPDVLAGIGTPARSPTDCSPLTETAVVENLSSGDLVVVDAQPLPTDKEQCKHGGWRQFGFKNQGQCVVFVVLTRVCATLDRYGIKTKFCPPTPPNRP